MASLTKNDDEMKVEQALIELNEIRNDLIFQKNEDKASAGSAPQDTGALISSQAAM